ncbi:DgsA anti-repressor MtfA [Pontibacter diazotrophicus]|uniref:DgsA anti-repressor MtfA n=1 Tax=Pontibacter diazotrophicus TaxID=1400979 RepID=A0A3D8LD12_9BACT|nr:zinc-dependent peptidase [Pontibacter diazotrophicus]RDV15280.1 DgsA anti-repressor MtfA [Pontibacter diazotrophicus]
MNILPFTSAFSLSQSSFCVFFGARLHTLELAELTPVEAVLMVVLVYALMQLGQYGVKQLRLRPFVKALRKQQPSYYASLPQHLKRQFEKRVANFLLRKTFIPRGGSFEVTLAMQVQIAAAAVQLTFGLKPVYLSHFSKILLYPDRYYSSISKRYHSGEVNVRGYIVLSWKDFEVGYRNDSDGFNLGLHEMAHALHLENIIQNNEHDFLDQEHLSQWNRLAAKEMQSRQQEPEGFLRLQACYDEHEFFAVSAESFFERPHDFSSHHPDLYQALTALLQQDPTKGVYRM